MASSSSSHNRSFSDFQREMPAASKKVYDAFINHRGPDVKDTLAFALYDSLEEKECSTFLDDQELQLGDSIESAIQNAIYSSRVQIAIFSPRYAESSWCLDELLLILETKAPFFPIFCDVKPSDLRYADKGAYAPAFALHEEKGRFSIEKIQQWKEALHSSSLISGQEFSTSNDNVEVLCTKIALAVQREVGKTFKGFPKDGEVGKQQKGLDADAAASTSTSTQVKKSSLLPRDSHPVGIQSKVEDIVGLLENPNVQVIAVVGMGGSGKTFLLQNVFKAVKSKYDYSIWLSVSKSYSVKNLHHVIGSQTGSKSEIEDAKEIWRGAELIHNSLLGKRSLIVLDDLWSISTENSLIDELGLPDDKDCKVLISTRNRQVALNLSAQIYEMKNLSDEDSWRLFCFYAFGENRAPPHIEEGLKIVKKCGNLPLAIKTIAASLASTTLLNKWQLKRRQLERVAATICDPVREVMEILKLSYDSLPWHLKPCFAYLSFFPDDEEIDSEYLINLWIAEGFVPAGEEQWDMAWDWLDQLAQLCLLQVYEVDNTSILTKYCKIHDMLHDLAIHISKQSKCVFSVEEVSAHISASTDWCRVLLAKKDVDVNVISEISPVYVRTLSLFQNEKITSIQQSLFTNMRGLRVLDLSYTKISTLPASVGKMILLKVLNLMETEIKEVPECVRRLKSLSFLALPDYCTRLPVWIAELKRLQHLECRGVRNRMPKEMSKLASLRTLASRYLNCSIEDDEFMSLGDLVNMTQLQELWLDVNHEMELKKIEKGILAQLVKMRCLRICNSTGEGMELPENVKAMQHLERLTLVNFVVPSWICELASVRELFLVGSECSNYPELQAMPNLVSLVLWENKRCRELPKAFGKSGGFPQLRYLRIFRFISLEEFPELEKGAMASLEIFELNSCPKVKKVEGLEHLKRLEKFNVLGGKNELGEMLKEGGEYWIKIKAVNPKVYIHISK